MVVLSYIELSAWDETTRNCPPEHFVPSSPRMSTWRHTREGKASIFCISLLFLSFIFLKVNEFLFLKRSERWGVEKTRLLVWTKVRKCSAISVFQEVGSGLTCLYNCQHVCLNEVNCKKLVLLGI